MILKRFWFWVWLSLSQGTSGYWHSWAGDKFLMTGTINPG